MPTDIDNATVGSGALQESEAEEPGPLSFRGATIPVAGRQLPGPISVSVAQQADPEIEAEPISAGPPSVAIPGLLPDAGDTADAAGAPPASLGPWPTEPGEGPVSLRHPIHFVASIAAPRAAGDRGYLISEGTQDAATVTFEGVGAPACRVARLGPLTIEVCPDAALEVARNAPIRVRIQGAGRDIGPVDAWLIAEERREGARRISLRVLDQRSVIAGQILAMALELTARGLAAPAGQPAPEAREITDREEIRQIVEGLSAMASDGTLRSGSKACRVWMRRVDALEGQIDWELDGGREDCGPGPCVVEIVSYRSVYRFHLAFGVVQGDAMSTPFPLRIQRIRQRWRRRGDPLPGAPVLLKYSHPVWQDLPPVERRIRDLTYAAIAFATDVATDLVFPGLELSEVWVEVPGAQPVRASAEIEAVLPPIGDEPALCWATLRPASSEDLLQWTRLVSQNLHPKTEISAGFLEPLWSLYNASGYFNLSGKSAENFEALRRHFFDLGRRAERLPELVCQAVWPSEQRVEASVSSLKAYETAWLAHQLAKRPRRAELQRSGENVLRDVYVRIFEHPQIDPEFRWMVSYLEPAVTWIRRAHLDFATRNPARDQLLSVPIRMMSMSCADFVDPPRDGVEIEPMLDADRAPVLEALLRKWPKPYIEALDFTEERLDMAGVTAQWVRAGLERERCILVARRGRAPIAAIVLETGQLGSNLFRLLDSARLIPLADDADGACVLLLDEARRWFTSRGRTAFMFLDEEQEAPRYLGAVRVESVSKPYLWIISAQAIPDLLQHVCELTAGRRTRRRRDADAGLSGVRPAASMVGGELI